MLEWWPAPLSFSSPVSSHHPIFRSSTFSICFLFILLISMPCLVNFLPHRDHNSFSERAKISKKLPTQNSTQNAFLFLSGDIYSDSLSLERSGVEWITPELSIESVTQCNKGQMSLKVKTCISKIPLFQIPRFTIKERNKGHVLIECNAFLKCRRYSYCLL